MAETDEFKKMAMQAVKNAGALGWDAILKQSRAIAGEMRTRAPRKTGKLADSVRLETNQKGMRVRILAGGKATTNNGYDYALAVEAGTHKAPAYPFFYPSWRANRPKAARAIKSAMKKGIESAKKAASYEKDIAAQQAMSGKP